MVEEFGLTRNTINEIIKPVRSQLAPEHKIMWKRTEKKAMQLVPKPVTKNPDAMWAELSEKGFIPARVS